MLGLSHLKPLELCHGTRSPFPVPLSCFLVKIITVHGFDCLCSTMDDSAKRSLAYNTIAQKIGDQRWDFV